MRAGRFRWLFVVLFPGVLTAAHLAPTESAVPPVEGPLPPGWQTASPRDEIRPAFAFHPAELIAATSLSRKTACAGLIFSLAAVRSKNP